MMTCSWCSIRAVSRASRTGVVLNPLSTKPSCIPIPFFANPDYDSIIAFPRRSWLEPAIRQGTFPPLHLR